MNRSLFTLLFPVLVFSYSCGTGGDKIRKREVIADKDLVGLLTDIYLADGLLSITPVRAIYSEKDSTSNYMDIIGEHGYSKERLDRSIQYYLLKNPKKLEKIYDQVIAGLSEMESGLETEMELPVPASTELWPGEISISVPESGLYNSISFDIQVSDTGMYSLMFDAIVYKDDQSVNPRTTVFFWKADTTKEGQRDYWENIELLRDGRSRSYSVQKRLTDTSYTHIKGFLLDHDPQAGRWQKHMRVTNIHLVKGGIE